jgi:hypothetical protein
MVSEGSGGEWRDGQTSTPGQVHRAHVRTTWRCGSSHSTKNAAGKRGDLGIWDENCAFRRDSASGASGPPQEGEKRLSRSSELDTVAITVLQMIESFAASIFSAHQAIGASNTMTSIRTTVFKTLSSMIDRVSWAPALAQSAGVSVGTTRCD